MKNGEVELVRPPVLVRMRPARLSGRGVDRRVLAVAAFVGHAVGINLRHVGPSPVWLLLLVIWLMSVMVCWWRSPAVRSLGGRDGGRSARHTAGIGPSR